MTTQNEEYFPRGGAAPGTKPLTKPKRPAIDNLFGNAVETKKRRKNLKHSLPVFSSDEPRRSQYVDVLSYQTIKADMVLLGCVRDIQDIWINVELPGRMFGKLSIKSISAQYMKNIEKNVEENIDDDESTDLSLVFKPGQYIVVKVFDILESGSAKTIYLTTDPVEINSAYHHKNIKTNTLLWGAVVEKSDHCYFIDIGVKNCRVILPLKNVDTDVEYRVGQPLYIVSKKCTIQNEASTVTVSSKLEDIQANTESPKLGLDYLIPGMQVDYLISQKISYGLEGNIMFDKMAYIHQIYLNKNLNNYSDHSKIKARVLYIEPSTQFVYLSTHSFQTNEASFKIGTKMDCTVLERIHHGLLIKLEQNAKGLVTNRRIISSVKTNEDLEDIISSYFPDNSKHSCKILDYNRMDELYICTFEKELLDTGIIHKEELKLGDVVEVEIKNISKNSLGVKVKAGSVEGFIRNIHLGNSEYNEIAKKKFKVGQTLKAKVVEFVQKAVSFTIKPDLVNNDVHLTSYDEAITDETFPGIVVQKGPKGVLVVFYGGVRGWLPTRNIPHVDQQASNAFYIGEVVNVRVEEVTDGNRLTLTMRKSAESSDCNLKIFMNCGKQEFEERRLANKVVPGLVVSEVKVLKVLDKTGLEIELPENESGILPVEHLAVGALGPTMLQKYEEGSVIQKVLVLSVKPNIIVSIRELKAYEEQELSVPDLDNLENNMLIRCSYIYTQKSKAILSSPIKGCLEKITVTLNEIDNFASYSKHQAIVAKIENVIVKDDKFSLKISTKLSDVFDNDFLYSINLLNRYMSDVDSVQRHLVSVEDGLGKLEVGQKVQCTVAKVDKNLFVTLNILPDNIKGLVSWENLKDTTIKKGLKVEGVILDVNYVYKCATLTLKPCDAENAKKLKPKTLEKKWPTGSSFPTNILLVNNDYCMGVMKNEDKRHIVYLPVRLHENDVLPNTEYYKNLLGKEVDVKIVQRTGSRLYGLESGFEELCIQNNADSGIKKKSKKKKSKKAAEVEENGASEEAEAAEIEEEEVEKPVKSKKKKHEKSKSKTKDVEDDEMVVADETEVEEAEKPAKSKKRKQEQSKSKSKNLEDDDMEPVLPGMGSFFNAETEQEEAADNSSSDEEESGEQKKKKKKLTNAERTELARQEEAKLRKLENDLVDTSKLPQSADQFDRVLLGNPNDSEMWTRYIAFHAQSTEFEKARAVAKRAIEKIPYTATQDKLNVWLAYLNLENMYGTKDSFNKVFNEALRCNDDLTIYLASIKMLAEMQKMNEMDDKIKSVRAKFKQDVNMWLEIAKIYYNCKRFVDARKMKDTVLTTITDKKTQLNFIVQFAIMEFNLGEQNQGEALFETILQADPKRVDVWTTYVDQLTKKDKIDVARNVLKRAVGQKLPYKKMKTLFKKYHMFEKNYGNEETLEYVKLMLKEYTESTNKK